MTTCPLSDCILPDARWQGSWLAAQHRPICTDCYAHPGVYFDGDEWRMRAHDIQVREGVVT